MLDKWNLRLSETEILASRDLEISLSKSYFTEKTPLGASAPSWLDASKL